MIRYSIIIPARNAAAVLPRCLAACARQKGAARADYEIIVVDDGSMDETAVIAKENGADRVIRHPHSQGAGAARNSGLVVAQGEIILFTDADCTPDPDWIAAMTAPFADPDLAGCKGIYRSEQRQLTARFVQIEYEDKYDRLRPQPTIDFIDTYSAAYRRDILQAAGGFDTRIFYVEDQELSFRLAAAHQKMIFQPNAVVAHLHSDSAAAYARKKFFIGYWKAQIMRLHPERVINDSHTPQSIKVQMGLIALLIAALFGGLIFRPFLWAAAAVMAIFVITTVPFVRKAWVKDRAVAAAAPFLLAVRAAALGFGYAWGMVRRQVEREE